jgi:hypothetical protein
MALVSNRYSTGEQVAVEEVIERLGKVRKSVASGAAAINSQGAGVDAERGEEAS